MKKGIYKHYKGNLYRVIGFGKHSETLEDLVFYEALYDNPKSKFWIRPMKMFDDEINTSEGIVRRFVFISED